MRFQSAPELDIIAPALIDQAWSESEAFGAATWLWMHADTRRELPLQWLASLLLPAIEHRQFLIASTEQRPVCFLSWACFDEAAEQRYLEGPPQALHSIDWNSGNRMWLIDWIAPFGYTRALASLLSKQLFANRWARSLDHRGNERGFRIKTFHGCAVDPAEAGLWFRKHPPALARVLAPSLAPAPVLKPHPASSNPLPEGAVT